MMRSFSSFLPTLTDQFLSCNTTFETAWRTLQGHEALNMIRKGQMQGVVKGDVRSQMALISTLFGVAA